MSSQGRQAAPDSALTVTLQSIAGEPLGLDEAIDMALMNATPLNEARAALAAAQGRQRTERGSFDPEAFANGDLSRDEVPTASPFSGASVLTTNQSLASSGVRTRLLTGTEVEASLQTVRTKTNSVFSALNPQYTTLSRLTVRQPLLAGSGPAANTDFAASRHARQAAQARLDDMVFAVRSLTEEIYWDLYAAERNYAVQRLIRDRASALLDESLLRSRAGLVGPSQVENARVFLAEQELALLDREEALDGLSDELSVLIGRRPAGELVRFRPEDDPANEFVLTDVASVVAGATRSNKGLQALQSDINVARTRLRAATRNRLPTVDLVGTLGANGLAGVGRDVVFGSDTLRTTNAGSFSSALEQLAELQFPQWNVGIDVVIPIGRRRRGGEIDRLQAEVDVLAYRYEAAARALEEEIRRFHRELANGARRLDIARQGVQASREQVRIGLVQFRNGRTTAFELVRLGADLASAEQRLSQALVRTAKAAAALNRLTSGAYDGGGKD